MTPAQRAWYKSRIVARLVDLDLHRVSAIMPDGEMVNLMVIGGKMRFISGSVITGNELSILEELVTELIQKSEQPKQLGLFA
mgnify:CR=1 FL=1